MIRIVHIIRSFCTCKQLKQISYRLHYEIKYNYENKTTINNYISSTLTLKLVINSEIWNKKLILLNC